MEETDFRDLLRRTEPECPAVNRTEIVLALTSVAATPRRTATLQKTAHGALVVTSVCLAMAAVLCGLAFFPDSGDRERSALLAEYHESQQRTATLEARLHALAENRPPVLSQAEAVAIRASESLWLLLQADPVNQRDQAETIVTLYANTPAADRCRQMFPDIIH